jgi:hypothetical protein
MLFLIGAYDEKRPFKTFSRKIPDRASCRKVLVTHHSSLSQSHPPGDESRDPPSGAMPTQYVRFSGAADLRMRLVCATLANRALRCVSRVERAVVRRTPSAATRRVSNRASRRVASRRRPVLTLSPPTLRRASRSTTTTTTTTITASTTSA